MEKRFQSKRIGTGELQREEKGGGIGGYRYPSQPVTPILRLVLALVLVLVLSSPGRGRSESRIALLWEEMQHGQAAEEGRRRRGRLIGLRGRLPPFPAASSVTRIRQPSPCYCRLVLKRSCPGATCSGTKLRVESRVGSQGSRNRDENAQVFRLPLGCWVQVKKDCSLPFFSLSSTRQSVREKGVSGRRGALYSPTSQRTVCACSR